MRQALFLAICGRVGHSSLPPPGAIFTDLCKLTPPRQLRAAVPYRPHDCSRELHIDCIVPECGSSFLLSSKTLNARVAPLWPSVGRTP